MRGGKHAIEGAVAGAKHAKLVMEGGVVQMRFAATTVKAVSPTAYDAVLSCVVSGLDRDGLMDPLSYTYDCFVGVLDSAMAVGKATVARPIGHG